MTTQPELYSVAATAGGMDLDHHSPEFRENAHAILGDLRSGCPVAHSSAHGGFWIFTDHASVFAATQDDDLFNSAPSSGIPASGLGFPILPIETDPPLTQKLRAITLGPFSPGAARNLRPMIREIATDLIDEFVETGACDVVNEFTTPLPARVMLRMMGIDESGWRSWVDRIHCVVHERAHDAEAAGTAGMSLFADLTEGMQARRDRDPESDLYARIVHGTVDGEPLDDIQVVMYGLLMMLGGMDTTSGLTGNALLELTKDDRLRQRLVEDRSLLPAATEEFLRYSTPTLGLARTVSRDAEFFGRHLKQGDRVLLMWASANRDATVFDDAETIDIDRTNRRHLAFGVGIHRCLGSNLAREMFQVMMDEILTRLPDFQLAGEPERFEDAGEVYAVRRLPITFTPGTRTNPR